ncbi:hypothetical protein SS50377_20889 [Spironucleus salmonicida]|uniref:Uncharacterized protein n=1 Tax=Spironucleus salmonicida TaxID=348837 RepID=V6LG79_9EUKA|nr:hypothetical protein SS50377_20889 [Spironucleus salmonicida]|eukprot:EST43565.1 Hypothetical protein SS50377_16604 [Spironucleus salmonicida]
MHSFRRPQRTVLYNGEEYTLFEFVQIYKSFQQMDNTLLLEEIAHLSQFRLNELKIDKLKKQKISGKTQNLQLNEHYTKYIASVHKTCTHLQTKIYHNTGMRQNAEVVKFAGQLQAGTTFEEFAEKQRSISSGCEVKNMKVEQLKSEIVHLKATLMQENTTFEQLSLVSSEMMQRLNKSKHQKFAGKDAQKFIFDYERLQSIHDRAVTTLWGTIRSAPSQSQFSSWKRIFSQLKGEQ